MNLWMKNTDGEPDAVLTMSFIAFMVVITKVLLLGVTIASIGVSFGTIDAAMVAAVLTPTLGAYVSRRYTDRKFDAQVQNDQVK